MGINHWLISILDCKLLHLNHSTKTATIPIEVERNGLEVMFKGDSDRNFCEG